MDLLSVFFIYSHFDGCIIQSKAYEKSLLEMFLLCSIFKYGIFGAEESYMFLPRNALRPLIVAFFGGRGALASVYARILLKSEYYNWRKDTTPRASCFFGQRESQILSPTTIKTGMAKICPFSMAYNYHVSSVCFQNFLQAFKVLVLLLYSPKI